MISQQAKVEPQGVRNPHSSAQVLSAMVASNLRVRGLEEASHSEGDAERSLLLPGRPQNVSLGTAACRLTRRLTLGINKFPS